ncbi:MAG: helix-turn-helix domain-containing protein [Candidatus Merdivicinus sp.]|jgi:AraC-like DNA-binding protein
MHSQSYYRLINDNGCNFRVDDRLLMVNCTGVYVTKEPFSNFSRGGRHDFYFMYLDQGELEVTAAGMAHSLGEGEMLIYPPEQSYGYRKTGREPMRYYWAHFSGNGAEELLAECGLEAGTVYAPGNQEETALGFQEMFRCFYAREALFEMEAAGQLAALLAKMARWAKQEGGKGPALQRIRKSLDYLYRNYAAPVRLEELAQMEHLSPSRYSAVFRGCMGVSPQGFLIGLRMKNAADLIRRTDLTITQVAQAVGYEDTLYFSTLFRRKMGLPPSRYREKFGYRT